MIKKIKIIPISETFDASGFDTNQILFRSTQKDIIGNSGSNPTWGNVFEKGENGETLYSGVGLYKEHDYDYPNNAYSEKIYSIIAKDVLSGVRVPDIDVVTPGNSEHGIISYRLLDNDTEDLLHIRHVLFNKYDRTAMLARKSMYTIDDILESLRKQIPDDENYKQVERNVIHTLLLDAVTNNSDRHPNNWALVRNKKSNYYELAIFDNSAAFIDMFDANPWQSVRGWTSSYISPDDNLQNRRCLLGKDIISLIFQRFPDYYKEFIEIFSQKLPDISKKILEENLPVNNSRVISKLEARSRFLEKTISEGDIDYD